MEIIQIGIIDIFLLKCKILFKLEQNMFPDLKKRMVKYMSLK